MHPNYNAPVSFSAYTSQHYLLVDVLRGGCGVDRTVIANMMNALTSSDPHLVLVHEIAS
jgi:hypothetical protein